ncbi:MAG: class I SAM-dependent methyltransferase [Candidatus Thermoplasmatota archaeon]|nr:class I SAM-dependent methyltransferase [Candidatus Thermoplasmatota archaeon]
MQNEWDIIARSFDSTRQKPWKECLDFIEGKGGTAIDIACGNGRHLIPLCSKAKHAMGMDFSPEMIKIARENVEKAGLRNVSLAVGDAISLPFKSDTFDFALFIAGLHNIRWKKNRIKALGEVNRVLKDDGEALISVWSKWQDRWRKHFLIQMFKPWKELGDILVPWKRDGKQVMRFYHLYSMRELKRDVKKAGLKIVKAWSVKKVSKKYADNYFVIVKKDIKEVKG